MVVIHVLAASIASIDCNGVHGVHYQLAANKAKPPNKGHFGTYIN